MINSLFRNRALVAALGATLLIGLVALLPGHQRPAAGDTVGPVLCVYPNGSFTTTENGLCPGGSVSFSSYFYGCVLSPYGCGPSFQAGFGPAPAGPLITVPPGAIGEPLAVTTENAGIVVQPSGEAPQIQPPGPGTSPDAATVTISSGNPAVITVVANQYLDFTHSIDVTLAPGVQAGSVQVSTGTTSIQGSEVIWNGFTMNAGDTATMTISLSVSTGATLTSPSAPSIQTVTLTALDSSANTVMIQQPGGGPTVGDLSSSCAPASGVVLGCGGAGDFMTPPFNVSGDWALNWSYGLCPNGSQTLDVSVLNPDGTSSPMPPLDDATGGSSGVTSFSGGGTFVLQVRSGCAWLLAVQQQ